MSCQLVRMPLLCYITFATNVTTAALFAKVQSFIILLNRQRVERSLNSASSGSPPAYTNFTSTTYIPSTANASDNLLHAAPIRGRAIVINSSIHLLQTFLFFRHRHPAVLVCWTLGQQAFNAAMILILDAWESGNDQNEWLVNQAFVVFTEMQTNGVHKLAELAVKRISDGLAQLGQRRQERANAAAAASAAMSRRQSQQSHPATTAAYPPVQQQPALTLDTSSLLDLSGDTVMGNTGMFLLEDSGLQTYIPQSFAPFNFALPTAAATYPYPPTHPSSNSNTTSRNPSDPPTPAHYSPPTPTTVPVSNVTVAPFPVMSPTFNFNSPAIVSTTHGPGPYAVGLQPRITSQRRVSHPTAGFVPVNAGEQQAYGMQPAQQQGYATYGGGAAHGHDHGHRHGYRSDRGPRSQSRRHR